MSKIRRKHTGATVLAVSLLCFVSILLLSLIRADFLQRQAQILADPAADSSPQRVVFLGATGVSWDFLDSSTAPHLHVAALSPNAQIANFVVKVKADTACPDEGWLTLNTGVRSVGLAAEDEYCRALAQAVPNDASWQITNWAEYREANAENKYDPQFGNLARALHANEAQTVAIGTGAAIALADADGNLPAHVKYFSLPSESAAAADKELGASAENIALQLQNAVDQAHDAQVIVADLGAIRAGFSPLISSDIAGGAENIGNTAANALDDSQLNHSDSSPDSRKDPRSRTALGASFRIPTPPSVQMRKDLAQLDARFAAVIETLQAQDAQIAQSSGKIPQTKVIFASLAESDRTGAKLQVYFEFDLADFDASLGAGLPDSAKLSDRVGSPDSVNLSNNVGLLDDATAPDNSAPDNSDSAANTDVLETTSASAKIDPSVETSVKSNLAYTNSTRIPGVVQNTDLLPTLVSLTRSMQQSNQDSKQLNRAVPADLGSAVGAPITEYLGRGEIGNSVDYLTSQGERAKYVRASLGWAFTGYALLSFAGTVVAVLLLLSAQRTGSESRLFSRHTTRRCTQLLLALSAVPFASFVVNLFSWWFLPYASFVSLALIGVLAALVGVCARVVAERINSRISTLCADGMQKPQIAVLSVVLIAALTAFTLAIDVIAGSKLHFSSIFGVQAQHAGRFYGFGNSGFVIFAVSMLIVTAFGLYLLRATHTPNWQRFLFVAVMLSLAVFVDGTPILGADFGGPPAMILAFMVLLLLHMGRRLNRRSILALVCLGLLGALSIAVLDWFNPQEQRTHLGAFIDSALHGDLFRVISRKIGEMFLEVSIYVWVLVLAAVIVIVWQACRRGWHQKIPLNAELRIQRKTLIPVDFVSVQFAIVALLVFALLINDSGLLLPFIGLIYGLPMFAALLIDGYFSYFSRADGRLHDRH